MEFLNNMSTEEKVVLGCTGVVVLAAGAVMVSNHSVNKKLKGTMAAVQRTAAILGKLEDTVDQSNYLLEQDQIDTKAAADKVLEGIQNLKQQQPPAAPATPIAEGEG